MNIDPIEHGYYLEIRDKISQAKSLRAKLDFKINQAAHRIQSLSESKDALECQIQDMENMARIRRSKLTTMAAIHRLGKRFGL